MGERFDPMKSRTGRKINPKSRKERSSPEKPAVMATRRTMNEHEAKLEQIGRAHV